jgi:hypothetical protein
MTLSHTYLNWEYLYRPANTWFELEAKATLFFINNSRLAARSKTLCLVYAIL